MPIRPLTRRSLLQNLALTTAATAIGLPSLEAQPQFGGSTGQQRGEMGRLAGAFRRQFSVPATSIAISRNGQFAYDQTIGMADRQHLTGRFIAGNEAAGAVIDIDEIKADGMLATCIAHEIEHLDGVLFVDHLSLVKRNIILRKLQKAKRAGTV